jgi:hypothetical protein
MADVAIANTTVSSAPKDYTLSGSQELLLKAVRANMDGSGAAAAWFPCLQLLAPDGTVMWESVPASSVAAGASADVSWFPRVGESGGSSAATISWATLFDNAISVPAGSTYTQYDFTAASFFTNDGTTFTVDSTNGLTLNSNGWYQYAATLEWEADAATTATYVEMQWNIPNIGHRFSQDSYADAGGGTFLAATTQAWGFPMKAATVGSHGKLFLRQFSDVTALVSLSFSVALLTSDHGNF